MLRIGGNQEDPIGYYNTQTPVGIIGGGQLARMLAISAWNLGLEPHVYSRDPSDPAAQVTRHWHKGEPSQKKKFENFLTQVKIYTFESEFIKISNLQSLSPKHVAKAFPNFQAMATLQTRELQKHCLDRYAIPTSPWFDLANPKSDETLEEKINFPMVLKQKRNGYDGYGTFILKNLKELKSFFKNKSLHKKDFIAEKWIPFQKEMALIVARTSKGEFSNFPCVESFQKDARCLWVKGPYEDPQLKQILGKIKKMLNGIDYVGVMGVELFKTKNAGLLINELAPRVHNTGHYSLDTGGLSQFDAHWLCGLGQDLPKKLGKICEGFAMVNLLGEGASLSRLQSQGDLNVHWYGKTPSRKGRKMGHLTALDKTPNRALNRALKALEGVKV